MDDIVADVSAGHNIVKTVFLECGAMFRADGPLEMRCVGETVRFPSILNPPFRSILLHVCCILLCVSVDSHRNS